MSGERGYDEVKYFNDSVYRVRIDDHNVPTLQQMLDFVKDVEQWMNADRSNIIAIHCKGSSPLFLLLNLTVLMFLHLLSFVFILLLYNSVQLIMVIDLL